MAHFAGIDGAGIVHNVIVAEQDFIDSGAMGDPANWIQTSYNTHRNTHLLGGTPFRGNFACVGYRYYRQHDIFMPIPKYKHLLIDLNIADWVSRDQNNPNDIDPPSQIDWIWDYENNTWGQVNGEYARQGFDSWVKNTETGIWEAPIPSPGYPFEYWDEANQTWKDSKEGITILPRRFQFLDGRDIEQHIIQYQPKQGEEPTTLDFFQNV